MSFHIGQKVVCVGLGYVERDPAEQGVVWPCHGEVYTVREIRATMTYFGTVVGLLLREIVNPILPYLGGIDPAEICFDQRDFRPLVETETETDISVFTEILTPSKQKVDA